MKPWIAFTVSVVLAILAYNFLFFITAPLTVFFSYLLEKTSWAGISIFIPGVIYFLITYVYLMRGWIGNWFRKQSGSNRILAA